MNVPVDCITPSIETIILGIIANGLTSMISHLGYAGKRILIDQTIKKDSPDPDLTRIIESSVKAAGELAELNGIPDDKLSSFLALPEVEMIVRQIFSSKLLENQEKPRLDLIHKEFLGLASMFFGVDESKLEKPMSQLLDSIIDGCDRALTIAIDNDMLSAHEAKSTFRHNILLGELVTIQKILVFLANEKKPSLENIIEFETKYRGQIVHRHGTITPPNFDKTIKIPINNLYVVPSFIMNPRKKGDEPQSIKMKDFLSQIHRVVILGTPGGGKSTFTLKLCSDLAANYSDRLFAGREITPILVILRDYGAEKKARNCSVLQYIEISANSKYQIQPDPDEFEYMFMCLRLRDNS
ncbi:MAG: hypothetical protein WB392_00805 [Methanotrichaceae archaeon]